MNSNKNKEEKNPIIDEILNEEIPEDEKLPDDLPVAEDNVPEEDIKEETEEEIEEEVKEPKKEQKTESDEEKDKRYKAQQAEAQIQVERNKQLVNKVEEAAKLADPTEEELLKEYSDWEVMSETERKLARKSFINEKRFNLINEGVQETKKISEWAQKVDTFLDESDGKVEYSELSGHEGEFRKFLMKDSHRGLPIDILLGHFLYSLPKTEKKRGSLFQKGGGGEKQATTPNGVITDADEAAILRKSNPREYERKLKAGKIKLEV